MQISEDIHKLTSDCETYLDTMIHLKQQKIANAETLSIGKNLQEKLNLLGLKLRHILIQQVADNFVDTYTPVKKLAEIAISPFGMLIRLKKFN